MRTNLKKICSYCLEEVDSNSHSSELFCYNCKVSFCAKCNAPLKKRHNVCYNCGEINPDYLSPLKYKGNSDAEKIHNSWKKRGQNWIKKSKNPIYLINKNEEGVFYLEKKRRIGNTLNRKLSNEEVKNLNKK